MNQLKDVTSDPEHDHSVFSSEFAEKHPTVSNFVDTNNISLINDTDPKLLIITQPKMIQQITM